MIVLRPLDSSFCWLWPWTMQVCPLIFLNALLDGAKAWLGWPEPDGHVVADE